MKRFDPEKSPNQFATSFGAWKATSENELPMAPRSYISYLHSKVDQIPESFDSRVEWGSQCPSLLEIRDQANCGSCWAFASSTTWTDRNCIRTGGNFKADLSPQDILSCCSTCGNGCGGGYTSSAWVYFHETGISTGGLYNGTGFSGTGCKPYSFAPCEHYVSGERVDCDSLPMSETPTCTDFCVDEYTDNDYENDRVKAGKPVKFPYSVEDIQREIMTNGPVEANINVFSDFFAYQSGVYYHTYGKYEYTDGHEKCG